MGGNKSVKSEKTINFFWGVHILLKKIFYAAFLILILLCGCNSGAVTSAPSSESTGKYFSGDIIGRDVFDLPVEGGTITTSVQCSSKSVELELFYAGPGPVTNAPKLKIDGNLVAIDKCWVMSAQALDDMILLVVNYGGDVTSMNFYAIDTAGNILLHVHFLDDNGMYLTNFDNDQYGGFFHYRLEGDRLIFQGTRRYHGPSIFVGTDHGIDAIELRDEKGNLIADQVGIPDDEVIERQYEMQYLGNGKFGPLTEGEITMTYGEFKQTLYENK
jgi:hypothetical protein